MKVITECRNVLYYEAYFISYTPYQKVFQVKFVDYNEFYISYSLPVFSIG